LIDIVEKVLEVDEETAAEFVDAAYVSSKIDD
jgi:hypothetical protein